MINSSSLAPELLDGLERYGVSPANRAAVGSTGINRAAGRLIWAPLSSP